MNKEQSYAEIVNAINGDYVLQASHLSAAVTRTINNINYMFEVYKGLPFCFPKKSIMAHARLLSIMVETENMSEVRQVFQALSNLNLIVNCHCDVSDVSNPIIFGALKGVKNERGDTIYKILQICIDHNNNFDLAETRRFLGLGEKLPANKEEL